MAKYNVTHSCGHIQTHDLFGPHAERERKVAWLTGRLCADCYRAEQAALAAKLQAVKTGSEMVSYVMGADADLLAPEIKNKMVEVLDYIIANLDKVPAAQRAQAIEDAISLQFRKIWGGNSIDVRRTSPAAIVSYDWRVFVSRFTERYA